MRVLWRLLITLSVCLTAASSGQASDAKVPGTPYHASGQLPCSFGNASPGSTQCDFGVIRGKSGNAEVHIMPPAGLKRVLTFIGSKVSADNNASVKASKQNGDEWFIEVNDYKHYQVGDSIIFEG